MARQAGLFDLHERYGDLSRSGDPLERLASVVDFGVFRPALSAAIPRKDRRKGGRPPLEPVMMFKILVLQALYGLSDERAEYQVRDRLSFMRFLGLTLADRVPDRTTIRLFRESLVNADAVEALFARFDEELQGRGDFALGGQIIDASIVEAPKQRRTREEKQQIRNGEAPSWPPAKARQKDTDARWTVKRGRVKKKPGPTLDGSQSERTGEGLLIPAFGYKSHINIDRRHRLIRRYTVTDAARPLPAPHQKASRARSAVRSAVEHVFAGQKEHMGLFICTIGLGRAKAKIGVANLAYNFRRLIWLGRRPAPA